MSFDRFIAGGTDEAVVPGSTKWSAEAAEHFRVSVNANAYKVFDLGGSSEVSIPGTARIAAFERRPFIIRDDWYDGYVFNVFVEMQVQSGGSVTAFIVDETDTIIWTSGACTATSWQEQTTTFTPTVGVKYYLHFQKADDTHDCWGYGNVTATAKAL